MENKDKNRLQKSLEKYAADVNPMNLFIGTDKEYEHEVALFLGKIDDSMNEEQLVETLRKIFKDMFNIIHDSDFQAKYREIVQEYLRLRTEK